MADSIAVYRIEHKTIREGPFVNSWRLSSDLHEVIESISTQDVKLPHPFVDFNIIGNDGIPYCMKFGCESLTQLKIWFTEPNAVMDISAFLTGIEKEGFVIAVYKVPAEVVYEGKSKKQVMYDYTEAELVEDLSPIELLD